MFRVGLLALLILSSAPILSATTVAELPNRIVISVKEQKLMLLQNGAKVVTYPISTSKFGVGDDRGRMTTPLGLMQVAKKIGDNFPPGAVFHNRRWTGEILKANAPGRDPVTTRIIWLRGLEAQNAHAFQRCIYIHGTPEEKKIGRPASYGCIRMKSSDVAELYDRVPPGALVQIISEPLPKLAKPKVPRSEASNGVVAAAARPQNEVQNPDRPPTLAKASRIHSTNTVVAANALAAPPQHLTENQPQAQSAIQNQSQAGSTESTGTLTVEEMRMGGALAAERRKTKLALGKRL